MLDETLTVLIYGMHATQNNYHFLYIEKFVNQFP